MKVSEKKKSSQILKYIQLGILFTVIVGVWVLFSVPVVFYHLQQQVHNIM